MKQSMIVLTILSAPLSSCGSEPASQEPVQLQPGLYEVSQSAAAHTPFLKKGPSSDVTKVCVSAADAPTFPIYYPRRFLVQMGASCDGPAAERVGNRLSGKVVCRLFDGVSGDLTLPYEGEVAGDSLDFRAKIQLNITGPAAELGNHDPDALQDLEMRVGLSRIGDCLN